MDFFGKYKRPKLDEGKMDSVSKTESAGYIPAEAQIELFISGRSEARPGEEGTI